MRVVADLETNGLVDATVAWCLCAVDIDTKEEFTFDFTKEDELNSFREWAAVVDLWIMHNGIQYDHIWIEKLLKYRIDPAKVVDTLVLSHLLKYKLEEGHSLEAWGDRLGVAKVGLDIDFSTYAPEIVERCKRDVEINLKLYEFLMSKLDRKEFTSAIQTEMEFAWICREMHENGFCFDIDGAKQLYNEIEEEVKELDAQIKAAFPPKAKFIREYTPRLTQHGTISRTSVPRSWTDLSDLTPGASFSLIKFEEFNPTSTKQIIERLAKYWDPTDRTDGYLKAKKDRDKEKLKRLEHTAWKINEQNLSTLSDDAPPAAGLLVKRLLLASRLRTLTEWMSFYNPSTGRIHGKFNGIGTAPHRMSHRNPNMGNIAAEKSIKYSSKELKEKATKLGGRMRAFWRAAPGAILVGCDMESAHLRIFAHLIDDDPFKEALLKGDKKLGTDPHSINARILSDLGADRDRAKTFIFTFLNGGAAGKVASIFAATAQRAKEALGKFIESYPGLKRFKEKDAKAWADRGYFVGPDGRFVVCDDDHRMLAWYLQQYESTLMKKANLIWREHADKLGIKYKQVNMVHDEFVTEVYGTTHDAHTMGKLQASAIRMAGEIYRLRIPMAGEYKVGKTWLEVH